MEATRVSDQHCAPSAAHPSSGGLLTGWAEERHRGGEPGSLPGARWEIGHKGESQELQRASCPGRLCWLYQAMGRLREKQAAPVVKANMGGV